MSSKHSVNGFKTWPTDGLSELQGFLSLSKFGQFLRDKRVAVPTLIWIVHRRTPLFSRCNILAEQRNLHQRQTNIILFFR